MNLWVAGGVTGLKFSQLKYGVRSQGTSDRLHTAPSQGSLLPSGAHLAVFETTLLGLQLWKARTPMGCTPTFSNLFRPRSCTKAKAYQPSSGTPIVLLCLLRLNGQGLARQGGLEGGHSDSLGTRLMALRGRRTRTVRMADRLMFCRSREYSTIL